MASREFESLKASLVQAAAASGTSGDRFDVAALRAASRSSPWPTCS